MYYNFNNNNNKQIQKSVVSLVVNSDENYFLSKVMQKKFFIKPVIDWWYPIRKANSEIYKSNKIYLKRTF
jgi:hypothetical protein